MFIHNHNIPLNERTKEIILRQGRLYRGTNSFHLEDKTKRKEDYYGFFDRLTHNDKFSEVGFGEVGLYFTSTTLSLIGALIYGISRINNYGTSRTEFYRQNNAKPILLAITNLEKYFDRMCVGLDSTLGEIEIKGKISFDDIIVVDSLEKLGEVCPHIKQREREFFRRFYME